MLKMRQRSREKGSLDQKMTSRDPTFCREFIAQTKEVLAQFPNLAHSWSIDEDEDHCVLEFPKTAEDGFPVTVEVVAEELTVGGHGFHQHFTREIRGRSSIPEALGLVRDLLSPGMRIRERLAAGSPFKWESEILSNGDWVREGSTGLLFWIYFGKRSERFYQNHTLPIREKMAIRSAPAKEAEARRGCRETS
jgi:hypothetical protein